MNTELKQLIEDASALTRNTLPVGEPDYFECTENVIMFNPPDPERGDLMKVAEAAELCIDFSSSWVHLPGCASTFAKFTKGDYQSLALAVLRAASAVLKARGE